MGDGSFDAPSDFEGQGSSGTSIWVWLGAGCLGLLVLFGAVLAFGIYRGVECYETARKRQSQMRSTAQSFAVAVREGSYRSAWRQMSTGYREQTTFEEFRGVFQTQAEKLGDGPVRLVGQTPIRGERGGGKDGSGGGDLQWAYRFAFSEALLPKVNVVSVVVSWTGVDTGNPVAVERATVERTRQNLRATPPGRLVTEFRKRLGSADYRGAWDLTAPSFQKERSFESFRADMRQQRDWLIGDGFEVARISLPVEESTTVVTRHGGLGRRATWSLTRETEGWRIRGLNVGGEKAHESKSDASADGGAKAPDGSAE